MKIAVIGATGWIGSTVVNEALEQGHQVIAISRQAPTIDRSNVTTYALDLLAQGGLKEALADADAVISAIGGRANGEHSIVPNTATRLLKELPELGVERLIWVGGAGSLKVANGETLLSQADFPNEYKGEAVAQGQALEVFITSQSALNWLFVSPAAQIFPSERLGEYRIGGDELLTDADGNSKISVQDYAKALIDEAQNNRYQRQRISVAY
ncbi:NAD(P)-dependent oxidoreductase [Pseudoalteromonas sp. S16_S37]|uniref:NAD(P)-dependent oxidoreductase n=1 Tax=Pseudoalteromonas sp. S16_S37 TaxID=2720228 RepID=UPI001681036F|nr:NAD(P)H-binding protein [Pseudoalteromonas sp. S16_S37]MBD1580706.1 NAD(P)H-binding protein [Pseudoalteromonas sp. S16_S37]